MGVSYGKVVRSIATKMEWRFIKERQLEGIDRAEAGDRYLGGKRRIDRAQVVAQTGSGEPVAAIAKR